MWVIGSVPSGIHNDFSALVYHKNSVYRGPTLSAEASLVMNTYFKHESLGYIIAYDFFMHFEATYSPDILSVNTRAKLPDPI